MRKHLPTAVVIFAIAGIYAWQSGVLDRRSPKGLKGDTCAGRERCVAIYMAPWCPHCKSAIGKVQKMIVTAQRGGKTGVRVIVGMENAAGENQAMAAKIAEGVVLDADGSLAKKLNVEGVPAYKVLDPEGSLLLDGQEAYQWTVENL